MTSDINPFAPGDPDRYAIWEMLVRRDIEAYLDGDWAAHARDFAPDLFLGIDAGGQVNPDLWQPGYPDLDTYSRAWVEGARTSAVTNYAENRRMALYRATHLRHIDISGDLALAHKKFDGTIARADGGADRLDWQTIYICRRLGGIWKIAGFVGFLPNTSAPRGDAR